MLELKTIKDFEKFLESESEETDLLYAVLEEKVKDINKLSRDIKRRYKSSLDKYNHAKIRYNTDKRRVDSIILCLNDKNAALCDDFTYGKLIACIYIFVSEKCKIKNRHKIAQFLLKFFINKSIEQNVKCKFLSFFDSNSDVDVSKYYLYKSFIMNACKENDAEITDEEFEGLFVSDELLEQRIALDKKREDEKNKKQAEKKKKRDDIKKAREEEKLRAAQRSKENIKKIKDTKRTMYSEYIDENSMQLRNNIIDIISLDNLIEVLRNMEGMTRKKLEEYKYEYNKKIYERELSVLYSILDQNERKKLKEIIDNQKDIVLLKIIYDTLISVEYLQMSIDEKKSTVCNILDDVIDYEIPNQIFNTNIVIFPYENFVDDEISSIIANGKSGDREKIRQSLNQQFTYLRTQNLSSITSNNSKAFHEILDTRSSSSNAKNRPLIINNNLKAYRYGAKKIKVCLVKLSVSEKNQILLKEKYHCEFKPHIMLSFALCDVSKENEKDFYLRANKNAFSFLTEIKHISEIFRNDFTKETFDEACSIIDSSLSQMRESKTDEMHI